MAEKEFTPKAPDYKGDGISIWKAIVSQGDNKGNVFLKVKVLGGKSINCFKFEDKKTGVKNDRE